ncbi:S9 family peptidase [Asticcacaulis sp. EMRT-3]|uniref:alpha/beta hydrolase family protein n=1 Tax=Asticcacaulis sp. EMRT-3 TaxID=3040349 RepID=UPI0024AF60E8|nr:S9 family peptidase [Asticcacaulis sp. EMRT-3]MDI7775243.1 S9 family peptidase [Asticcacaulis sp. EMRT-3]
MTSTTDRRAFLTASSAIATFSALPGLSLPRRARADTTKPAGPPDVAVYAGSPLVDQIALSPDGQRIAIVSQKGDNKILMHFDINNPQPKSLSLGQSKVRGLFWGDNAHVVLIDSQTTALTGFAGYRHEFSLAHSINIDTGEVAGLYDNMGGFYNVVLGNLQRIKTPDGYRVTASNYRLHTDDGTTSVYDGKLYLYSFSLDKAPAHRICDASQEATGFVVGPDGTPIAYDEHIDLHNEWNLYINGTPDNRSPAFRLAYSMKDPVDLPSAEGIGRDGQSVVVFFNKGDYEGQFREISVDGKVSEPLDPQATLDRDALFHPVTRRLAGFRYYDDWQRDDYFEPLLKKLAEALPQVVDPGDRVRIVDFAEDPRKMLIYSESPHNAGTYAFIDFSTGAGSPIATNYGDLPTEWITQKQPIDYKAADGLDIHAYLTVPPDVVMKGRPLKNLPLIVLPHGGPWARDYVDFDWQAQVLASRGYVVLQPNYRGSSGNGRAFMDAGNGEFGRKMQTDLSDGVRHLVVQGLVDPKRVAILGASYGGYAALAGATMDTGVYNCAVSVAGLSDVGAFVSYLLESTNNIDTPAIVAWRQVLGDKSGWDDISPVHQAARASCPILLLHGTDDTVVPINQSQRMESALKAAGKTVTFITYQGQDHWETIGSTRIEMMKAALDFLEKYNPA